MNPNPPLGTFWVRRGPTSPWEGAVQGFLVLVRPPYPNAPLRDYTTIDYAGINGVVAEAWIEPAERDLDCSSTIRVETVPATVPPQVPNTATSFPGACRHAFQYVVEGGGPPRLAQPPIGLFQLLGQAIQDHRRLNPWDHPQS